MFSGRALSFGVLAGRKGRGLLGLSSSVNSSKSSAALPVNGAGCAGDGILCRLSLTVPESSRKGLRDTGLGGGSLEES